MSNFSTRPILDEDFDKLDREFWKPEVTMASDYWEFQMYLNEFWNPKAAFAQNGNLFIKPYPTADWMGEERMKTGMLDLDDSCTRADPWGCQRIVSSSGNYLNPITSAMLTTKESFNFRYGRLEIRAKMPSGDWTWP